MHSPQWAHRCSCSTTAQKQRQKFNRYVSWVTKEYLSSTNLHYLVFFSLLIRMVNLTLISAGFQDILDAKAYLKAKGVSLD